MKNILKKEIAYAFPTSKVATDQGFKNSGCYYIQYTLHNIEGSGHCQSFEDEQVGFFKSIDKDLINSFYEADGEICSSFLKYNSHFLKV